MKSLMQTMGGYTKGRAGAFWALSKAKRYTVLLLLLAVPILFSLVAKKEVVEEKSVDTTRVVNTMTVGALSENLTTLSLFGTVTSKSEAMIRAESGGKIVGVYKKLGDYAPAGTVIAEFENSAERAQVLSAEGAYDAAALGKDIAGISLGSSDNALLEAKTQALNVLSSTYTGLDDAIRTKTDIAWTNPQMRDAHLVVTISDAKLVIELEAERTNIETVLRAREAKNRTLTTGSDLIVELTLLETEANTIKKYLDDLSLAFNRALADTGTSQSEIDGYKAVTAGARAAVGGLVASIANTRNALNASLSANLIAEKNSSGEQGGAASASDAQVKSALGNLRGAQSRLEKTIIRSPISGTINSLSISTGDFISPYAEVAVISNNSALEVLAYVTEEDAREIVVGGNVAIEGGAKGIVTRVAPALDPKTKKIEVRIGIVGGSTLINGQSVTVELVRSQKKSSSAKEMKVPLSALKITPSGIIVFTVSTEMTLIAHRVKEGALFGDQVVITEGVTREMEIVVDARGLQEGMQVTLAK